MAAIVNQYRDVFMIRYGKIALPGQLKVMNAICRCRTTDLKF